MSYEFTMAITDVLLDTTMTEKVISRKLGAILSTFGNAMAMKKEYIATRIADPIWQKRLAFIMDATSISEINEIMKGYQIHYDGNAVVPKGRYWILEEELYMLSQTSFLAPLNTIGFERYEEVFRLVFPDEAAEIFG